MHGVQSLSVREVLNGYAQRGVFRSLSESETAAETRFRFRWLWNAPFELAEDKRSGSLVFKAVLPGIAAGSALEAGVKSFLADCQSPDRVEHRRIGFPVTYSRGTLRMKVAGGNAESAARQTIQLVNELFTSYLAMHHPNYLAEHYHVPED